MYRMEEWDDFLDALYLRAMKTLKTSQIFEYQQERQKQRDCYKYFFASLFVGSISRIRFAYLFARKGSRLHLSNNS